MHCLPLHFERSLGGGGSLGFCFLLLFGWLVSCVFFFIFLASGFHFVSWFGLFFGSRQFTLNYLQLVCLHAPVNTYFTDVVEFLLTVSPQHRKELKRTSSMRQEVGKDFLVQMNPMFLVQILTAFYVAFIIHDHSNHSQHLQLNKCIHNFDLAIKSRYRFSIRSLPGRRS